MLAIANAVLGMSLGLFLSAFASTEFQAVQFMPAFILSSDPALRAAGAAQRDVDWLNTPRGGAALHLRLRRARASRGRRVYDGRLILDVAVLIGWTLLAVGLGAATLRRRAS